MSDDTLRFSFSYARMRTLQWFGGIDEATALKVAPGFGNHILWHLGHIHAIAENVHEALGQPREHSDEWWQLFKYGAKPLETPPGAWPSAGEILQRLRDQGPRLEAAIAAADEQALAAPNPSPAPHRPDTVRGWIVHTIQHENLHLGMISSMRNMLKRLG